MKLADYIKGKRTGKEANRLQRQAMRDPMLSDALDGYDMADGDHEEAIRRMQDKVRERTSATIIPEVKKKPRYDLQNKKLLFFEIGLAASLAVAVLVFKYSESRRSIDRIDMGIAMVEEEVMEITTQDQKPPELQKQTVTVVSDVINIVKDDAKVATSLDFSDFSEEAVVVAKAEVKEEVAVSDEPFLVVEDMPKFQGGDLNDFRNWVQKQLKYPAVASENGISGRVTLQFVIEKDGSLSNIVILQTPDRSLSEEAERVLKTSPKWTPGKQRNVPVRVKYTLPVDFRLQEN